MWMLYFGVQSPVASVATDCSVLLPAHGLWQCKVCSCSVALQAVGDSLVDSVVSDNIPIFTEEEKFNEAVSSIVKRVEAKLTGGPSCASQHDGKRFLV